MDLNVAIFFTFDIGFEQENISAGSLQMGMCCPNCSTYYLSLVPKWFPLRTNDPNHPHVVTEWSSISQYLVPKWSPSNHKIVRMWSKLSPSCYKVATKKSQRVLQVVYACIDVWSLNYWYEPGWISPAEFKPNTRIYKCLSYKNIQAPLAI